MIVVFVSLIFYIVDPFLGILLALALPYAVALDANGEYSHALVAIVFAVVVYFVRKVAYDQTED